MMIIKYNDLDKRANGNTFQDITTAYKHDWLFLFLVFMSIISEAHRRFLFHFLKEWLHSITHKVVGEWRETRENPFSTK